MWDAVGVLLLGAGGVQHSESDIAIAILDRDIKAFGVLSLHPNGVKHHSPARIAEIKTKRIVFSEYPNGVPHQK